MNQGPGSVEVRQPVAEAVIAFNTGHNHAGGALFADRCRARQLYSWLVRGWNLVLRLLGRRPIGADAGIVDRDV